jgi:SAM-dependent methyltransferase
MTQIVSALGCRVFGPIVYNPRLDASGDAFSPEGVRGLLLTMNQAVIERGMTPPWIMTRAACQEYWSTRGDGSDNGPDIYRNKPVTIVDFLERFWRPEIDPQCSVLELGCNAGTNLERLRQLGYDQLSGIEINPAAVAALRGAYPELASQATITVDRLEEVLPTLEARSVDGIFTMAVLMHIHPSSDHIFDEMARVARRHICVIEPEVANNSYVFARNYRRVFERRGLQYIRSTLITSTSAPDVPSGYHGYTAHLFTVRGAAAR